MEHMSNITVATSVSDATLADVWAARESGGAASEAVFATLREAILSGILSPGARLPEEELAAQFDVSRTPIREAVLRLEATGLASRTSRRGLIVSAVSAHEILEVYAVREAIDGLAARLAAEVSREPYIFELVWLNDQLESQRDADSMARVNLRFHETVAQAGGNTVLLELMKAIHDRVRRFPGTTFSDTTRAETAVREHAEIVRSIEKRDGDTAERLARQHMANAMRVRIAMLHSRAAR